MVTLVRTSPYRRWASLYTVSLHQHAWTKVKQASLITQSNINGANICLLWTLGVFCSRTMHRWWLNIFTCSGVCLSFALFHLITKRPCSGNRTKWDIWCPLGLCWRLLQYFKVSVPGYSMKSCTDEVERAHASSRVFVGAAQWSFCVSQWAGTQELGRCKES